MINGSGVAGGMLTMGLGGWSPSGTSKAIRWQRSTDGATWSDIGATGLSYTTQPADLGAYFRVIVTETNSFGQASATSASFGPIASGPPQVASSPVITGVPQVGSTISASPGTWVPAAPNYAYTWQYSADGQTGWVSIPGALGASYTIGAGDAGTYLRVRVTATNAVGTSTAVSSPLGPVTVPTPVNTVRPTVAGTARVGLTLGASAGRWSMAGTVDLRVAVLGRRTHGMGDDPRCPRRQLHDQLCLHRHLPAGAGPDGGHRRVQRVGRTGRQCSPAGHQCSTLAALASRPAPCRSR